MSNESTVWKNLTETTTIIPQEPDKQDGYVLLLVLLSVFVGGALVLLSVTLIVCRHCCKGDRCFSSDDPEKTNVTYQEEPQPVPEITIQVDEADCLSTSSCHDVETERFLSTGTTGRRVSFNEAALFDHGKKTQEKGRRYTLTEGDFHHLKNARLTHLQLPASALKIVTIHECESSDNSMAMATCPPVKSSLSIFQPPVCALPQTALTGLTISLNSPLPGDTLNSMVDTSFSQGPMSAGSEALCSGAIEAMGAAPWTANSLGMAGDGAPAPGTPPPGGSGQGHMLQFFTKLRRHASLEGTSPYFKIKKWKLDSSQRASSLDTRGSPKRRHFQRQRAASESMDQEEHESHRADIIQYIARRHDPAYCCGVPAPSFLSPPSNPPPSLGRLEVEVTVEPSCSGERGVIGASPEPQEEGAEAGATWRLESMEPQTLYHDIWTLRASLEQYASSDQSSNNDKDSVRSDADSVCSLGGGSERRGLPSYPSQDVEDELEGDVELSGEEARGKGGKQDSVDSERGSDGESGNRKLLQMDSGYASIEAPCKAPEELRLFGSLGSPKDKTASEKRRFFTSAGRKGTVCESFEASLEEETEDEAAGGSSAEAQSPMGWSPYGQMFTSREPAQRLRRRDYSIDEKTDALFHEFLRHDPQFDQQESPLRSKHRSRVHLRKQWQRSKQYSDPGVHLVLPLDRQRSPLRRGDSVNYPLDTCYHSTLPRIISAPDEEASEGTSSAGEPEWAEPEEDRCKVSPSSSGSSRTIKEEEGRLSCSPPPGSDGALEQPEDSRQPKHLPEPPDERLAPPPPGYGPQTITAELTDKLTANLEERLYTSLRKAKDSSACMVAVTRASPDHSPV
ncbi:voltage-dependent calcium channel beta subunit-associated regulatory protein-like [Brienomyrus brachyistius]|uniref:voltage-dependent calcium channel beta subunit-associated regulatory protein-like n=1 Tax=Brienomyrus brachyistius TaxID=42636 RepID=UPI0020B42BE1|nr:voltage-dependent calcium channel beta subunit-associated regulatory protein-like [Brienomyrus brachyistius]XP_048832378.1 voltage-dependent calcium channel beta subunit-associated regulatory protein-like [Brienomyrus brachyistius]XP_048832379.1 voltage-dependent calcium channel beta subunit-associated regulatory protein-like [Brienomyrus brachyistius]XP_048832380.1 voltage-dependent calcium channel beta subunit-associated regulatory protein-like [Brienomyrus brachyistius]XP_048832381.1 volt